MRYLITCRQEHIPTVSVFAVVMSARDHQPHATLSSAIESALYCACVGFVPALVVILLGAMLYLGISGKGSWVAWAIGSSNEIFDALPGAALIVAGILLIRGTRHKPVVKCGVAPSARLQRQSFVMTTMREPRMRLCAPHWLRRSPQSRLLYR